jgi:hypothetical protein
MKSKQTNLGYGKDMPPTLQQVRIYFSQKKQSEVDAKEFYHHYKYCKWKGKRDRPVRDWKAAASNWIWEQRPVCFE